MQIVIDIDDKSYERIIKHYNTFPRDISRYEKQIIDGTPLPKGHGDLVDRDKINGRFYDIWKELESYSNKPTYKELLDKWSVCMDTAPTIIEADKAESGEQG